MAPQGKFGRKSVIGVLGDSVATRLGKAYREQSGQAQAFVPSAEKYAVTGRLGSGGMGDVLLVRDHDLRREIAMKVLHADLAALDDQKVKFVSEAQATSQLEHPGVPPVYDLGVGPKGEVYFTMKVVRGRTLEEIIAALADGDSDTAEEFTLHRLVSVLERICEALHFAHEKGVIHRDLKPENVMLGAFGEVHVIDWGIARTHGGDEGDVGGTALDTADTAAGLRTIEGTVKGTVPYMSPEQAHGEVAELDRRSDVYAVGCLLYEMLTLRPAYEAGGDSVIELLLRVRRGEFVPVAERNTDHKVPPALGDLCTRAMARERDRRPSTAAALGAELRAWLDGSAERERRHAEAERLAAEGMEAAATYRRMESEIVEAEVFAEEEAAKFKPWQPVREKRSAIRAAKRVEDLRADVALAFAETTRLLDAALVAEEDNATARAALADLWRERLVEAESAGERPDVVHADAMVRRYDDGRLAAFLAGDGTLDLASEPPGAEVLLYRFAEQDGVLTPVDEQSLGATPLAAVSLPMGSYLCVLRMKGFRGVRYPVHVSRNRAWQGTVRMLAEEQIGEGFVYVPGGPFVYGEGKDTTEETLGDFVIATYPVTFGEWGEFLAAVEAEEGIEAASALILNVRGDGDYMERGEDGVYRPLDSMIEGPVRERYEREYGADFLPQLPLIGVSWHDANAYCEWKTKTTGREWRLPTEQEREKVARGVDGRRFPWGDAADASLCKNRDSRDEGAQPEPVGTFATAASVYGMGDAAGNVYDWTSSLFEPDVQASTTRAIRGGSWGNAVGYARAAYRYGHTPEIRLPSVGFRPASSV